MDRKSVASGNHCHPQSAPLSSPLSGGGGGHNNGGGGSERGPEETHGGRESSLQEAEEEGEEVMSMWQMRNFFDWLRRPYLIAPEHATSNVQLARTIDHVSKTAFTLLFALFAFFYFLTYAFIKVSVSRVMRRLCAGSQWATALPSLPMRAGACPATDPKRAQEIRSMAAVPVFPLCQRKKLILCLYLPSLLAVQLGGLD